MGLKLWAWKDLNWKSNDLSANKEVSNNLTIGYFLYKFVDHKLLFIVIIFLVNKEET